MNYIKKFKGQNVALPATTHIKEVLFAFLGGFIAISIIGYMTQSFDNLLVLGSFGASCVLIFAYDTSPFSQPRNVILGHFFATLLDFFSFILYHKSGGVWP